MCGSLTPTRVTPTPTPNIHSKSATWRTLLTHLSNTLWTLNSFMNPFFKCRSSFVQKVFMDKRAWPKIFALHRHLSIRQHWSEIFAAGCTESYRMASSSANCDQNLTKWLHFRFYWVLVLDLDLCVAQTNAHACGSPFSLSRRLSKMADEISRELMALQ